MPIEALERPTITPAALLERRPDLVLGMWDRLKENKTDIGTPRNILLVPDVREDEIEAYTKSMNDSLGVDIREAYQVITYEGMLETLKVSEIGDAGAIDAAKDLVKELLPEEYGEKGPEVINVTFLGEIDLYRETIKLGRIIISLLENDRKAIAEAIRLTGRDDLTIDDLKGKVIDLRPTRNIEKHRRAMRETKTAS